MVTTIRKYDIKEYVKKGEEAIDKMMANQQAGQLIKGSKNDVCLAMREKLQAAVDAGYTLKQIAEVLRDEKVFGILPKSLLEILKIESNKPIIEQIKPKKPKKPIEPLPPVSALNEAEAVIVKTQRIKTNNFVDVD